MGARGGHKEAARGSSIQVRAGRLLYIPSAHLLYTFCTPSVHLLHILYILYILYTSPSVVIPIRLLLNMRFLHLKAVYNDKQAKNYPLRARLLPDARSASPLVSATVLLRAASIASR